MMPDLADLSAGQCGHVLDEQFDNRGTKRLGRQHVAYLFIFGLRYSYYRRGRRRARVPARLQRRAEKADGCHLRPTIALCNFILHPETGADHVAALTEVVGVHEHVLASIRRLDKTVPAHVIKTKNSTNCHLEPTCHETSD